MSDTSSIGIAFAACTLLGLLGLLPVMVDDYDDDGDWVVSFVTFRPGDPLRWVGLLLDFRVLLLAEAMAGQAVARPSSLLIHH